MSINVKNITKIYGTQKALDDVSFEIKEGEIVGLLGPNGAGKSTLMKILSCYIPASSGEAYVQNFNCNSQSIQVRQNIGYLPETNPLYSDMYVVEYLKFIGSIYKIKDLNNRVEEMIALTGLGKEKHKKIEELSKGYKQRVGLAQSFIHNPEVLILDEPTSGLDPNQLIEIRNLIKEIGKHKTVLFSSHIMQEVEAICDRVLIINNGKLIADSPIKELQNLWLDKEIIEVKFKESANLKLLKNISGVAEIDVINDHTFKITARTNANIREKIYAFSKENQLTLIELKAQELKLEDVFQKLTMD
ncbi:MAG: gliding motility-associated ABC transporter ATP-binding subunit GldA [Bacteroidetes bacterium CG2_30_33_31]|nr:MAG: gliding motility-associated ABC transporter ATP-binding subunit GldA [Bacteroidetes bacterium CG2_30_33_31]